jgi:catalase
MVNPKGRANYEPNSWPGEMGGPRESPDHGFVSHHADEQGQKIRIRAEAFADHYSQARQFYISQTTTEQRHIAAAFVFELSKVENPAIRARMVSHLLNVHDELADTVSKGLRLQSKPKAAIPARQPRTDLKESPALSIMRNGPESFRGRKVGALLSDGVNAELVGALRKALEREGALLEFIAPAVGGVEANDGTWIEASQKIDGGPSVLYDAVALLVSEEGARMLLEDGAARDFISDAYMHAKFIGHVQAAAPLVAKALGNDCRDGGFIELDDSKKISAFVQACRQLRFWEREDKLMP